MHMEKEGPPQPLVLQPAMATAPPMSVGEAVPYHPPQQDPYTVDLTSEAPAPPPYQPVDPIQQAMHGYSAPLLQQPTGYQAQGYPAPTYPQGYLAPTYPQGYPAPTYPQSYLAPTYPQGYLAPTYPTVGYVQQPQLPQVPPSANIVVMTQQPVVAPVVQTEKRNETPTVSLVFTIVMILGCLMIGNILALSCLIPSLVVASVGVASSDNTKRTKFGNASLLTTGLSLLIWSLLIIAIPIITAIGFAIVPPS